MIRKQGIRGWAGVSISVLLCTAFLGTSANGEDASARAVRLSTVDGSVQIAQGSQVLADPAVANTPLFEGTRVTAADNGRAEIQFEDGSVARLSPNSALTLSALRQKGDGMETEVVLEGGLGYFELQGANSSTRIRFGDAVVTVSGFTVLRINLDNPPGELAVFSGNAHLERGSSLSVDLHGGESVALNGVDPSRYNLAESIEPDSWDTWNADRDQVLTAEAAARTTATGNVAGSGNPAWSDLDANGNWYNVPDAGYVWSPNEAATAGWDPYGNGYWQWTPRFGYVWVSGYSWGYMPYQCGMWNFYDGLGWGWAPGMNGCQTWWGSGYIGPNIGYAPGGYLPPHWPRRPINGPPGGGRPGPHPLVAVNRRPIGAGTGLLASRDRNAQVVIAGQTVQALRPLAPRQQYDRSSSATGGHGPSGSVGRQGYTPAPSDMAGRRPGTTYTTGSSGSTHTASTSHASSGSAPSASHPYSGGSSSPSRSPVGGSSASGGAARGGGEPGGGGSHGGGGGTSGGKSK